MMAGTSIDGSTVYNTGLPVIVSTSHLTATLIDYVVTVVIDCQNIGYNVSDLNICKEVRTYDGDEVERKPNEEGSYNRNEFDFVLEINRVSKINVDASERYGSLNADG